MSRVETDRSGWVSAAVAIAAAFALALLLAASASAAYEQVATFASGGGGSSVSTPQEEQFEDVTAIAVNTTGAGGVPAGTVYAATGNHSSIAVYGPHGEFREVWGWGVATDNANEFERCGPDGEPAHPVCSAGNEPLAGGSTGEGVGQFTVPQGISVDQATGDVYITNSASASLNRSHNLVEVFSADGTQAIARFGDIGAFGETFAEGPDNLHGLLPGGIAVDDSGTVFVADRNGHVANEWRIMVFEPETPSDHSHYSYAGTSDDIADSHGGAKYFPQHLALDGLGHIYTAWEEKIFEFSRSQPATPICEFTEPKKGIEAIAVVPETGEVFYSNSKTNEIYQMSACNAEGHFIQRAEIATTIPSHHLKALAFNPKLSWGAPRDAGVLYAADDFTEPLNEMKLGVAEEEWLRGRGFIFAPAEARPATVESQEVLGVTATTASLRARIDPRGFATRYVFQYLTAAQYEANRPEDRFAGASEAPLGGAPLGSGSGSLSATAGVVGLSPDTEYRYRVVAGSHCEPASEETVCEVPGAAKAFRTFPLEAGGLHDGRAWELVSPVEKQGGEVFPADPILGSCKECKPGGDSVHFPMQSAPGGDAVVYEGSAFSNQGARVFNEYLSRRTSSGWQTTVLSPTQSSPVAQGYRGFNTDLTEGVLYQIAPSLSPEAPSEYANLYRQSTADPLGLSPLLTVAPPDRSGPEGSTNTLKITYVGASADLSRLFFEANDALTGETSFAPAAVDGGPTANNLYEWSSGQLRLVNVAPGNAATSPGAAFGLPQNPRYPNVPAEVSVGVEISADLSGAISAGGSRVFWSDASGQVFVREDGERTREIPDPGAFLAAAADGSRVLLYDGHLFNLENEALTDLTQGKGGFKGILGQSEDLSQIDFVDTEVLASNEGAALDNEGKPQRARAGKNNLYAWHEGKTTFVATLLQSDGREPIHGSDRDGGDWESPVQRTAEASPDGRWLAFISQARLTGYENLNPSCEDSAEGHAEFGVNRCSEVFLYDSVSGTLRCASCNPSGARPLGASTLRLISFFGLGSLPQPRYLTDQGRLFFDSQDSLTPSDSNHGVEDVYEYEPSGVGTCGHAEGCVSLISAGHGSADSNFLASDESGRNVFFTTRDQLVHADHDELIDLYDAREGGGISSQNEKGGSECQGEACQSEVAPPSDPTPASSSFEGAGNLPPGCHRDTVRRHGKCVPRRHHRRHKHKRWHKRAQHKHDHKRGGAK